MRDGGGGGGHARDGGDVDGLCRDVLATEDASCETDEVLVQHLRHKRKRARRPHVRLNHLEREREGGGVGVSET
jgi:hypothetical protein